MLALVVLPPDNEVVFYKLGKFRLEIFKKHLWRGLFVYLDNPLLGLPFPYHLNDLILKTFLSDN